MASSDDGKGRQEEEARIRGILRPQATDDPKVRRELDKKRAESAEKHKTGNFALVLLALIVLSALAAAANYLMGS